MARRAWLLVVTCALLLGCDDDLPRATEVIGMRVLGVQLEVEDDESRTTPEPGERVFARMPTVFETLDRTLEDARSMFIGCTAPDRFTGGLPICQEIIDAALAGADAAEVVPMIEGERLRCTDLGQFQRAQEGAVSAQCVNDDPVAVFEIPDDFEAEGLLILGVICERGRPYLEPLDPLLFGCEDAGDGEAVRVQGVLTVQQRSADENHNPSLDALTIEREGQRWDPAPADEDLPPEENCEGAVTGDDPALHRVVPGNHRITLRYQADAREESEGEPEDLEFTVYTTLGEMERRFTLFDGTDEGDEDGLLVGELDWDPPTDLDTDDRPPTVTSRLVRFFITLRDQRGGFAITERALCLR